MRTQADNWNPEVNFPPENICQIQVTGSLIFMSPQYMEDGRNSLGTAEYVCVLVAQLCLTLCDPTNCSLPGFSVHGILQARILEWTAIPFSRGTSQHKYQTLVSYLVGRFFTILTTGKP